MLHGRGSIGGAALAKHLSTSVSYHGAVINTESFIRCKQMSATLRRHYIHHSLQPQVTWTPIGISIITVIHVKKTVRIWCKGDIMVVDIKKAEIIFKNSNFTITQSAKFF